MKKILLVFMVACLMIPSAGWGKQFIYWFTISDVKFPDNTSCRWGYEFLHIYSPNGNLKFTVGFRDGKPSFKKIKDSTFTYFQAEPSAIYNFDELIPDSNWHLGILEVIINSGEIDIYTYVEIKTLDDSTSFKIYPIQKK